MISYNNQPLPGSSSTPAYINFNSAHPLYQIIAALVRLRAEQPALRHRLQVVVAVGSRYFTALFGHCATTSTAPGSYHISLATLDYLVCVSGAHP